MRTGRLAMKHIKSIIMRLGLLKVSNSKMIEIFAYFTLATAMTASKLFYAQCKRKMYLQMRKNGSAN